MAISPFANGSRAGSLMATFWCCVPRSSSVNNSQPLEGDEPFRQAQVYNDEVTVCFEQPRPVEPPRAVQQSRPSSSRSRSHSVSQHVSQLVATSREMASRASLSITRPRTAHSTTRPTIGAPMNFRRHSEDLPGQRRRMSFKPLELPTCLKNGRLSPLPDFAEEDWDQPTTVACPPHALVRPCQMNDLLSQEPVSRPTSRQGASSSTIQRKPVPHSRQSSNSSITTTVTTVSHASCTSKPEIKLMPAPPPRNRAASLHSSVSQSGSLSSLNSVCHSSRMVSPSRARSNTEPGLFSPKNSIRRPKADVDEAIRELVTIVEERRADALRSAAVSPFINEPPKSPLHHVPAIAPSYKMHVRSETLSDIGSAFVFKARSPASWESELHCRTGPSSTRSSTTTFKPSRLVLPVPPTPTETMSFADSLRNRSQPSTPTSLSRLASWLRRSASTSTKFQLRSRSSSTLSGRSIPLDNGPFYKCQPNASSAVLCQSSSYVSPTVSSFASSSSSLTETLGVPELVADDADTDTIMEACTIGSPVTCPSTPARRSIRNRGFSEASKVGSRADVSIQEEQEEDYASDADRSESRQMQIGVGVGASIGNGVGMAF